MQRQGAFFWLSVDFLICALEAALEGKDQSTKFPEVGMIGRAGGIRTHETYCPLWPHTYR